MSNPVMTRNPYFNETRQRPNQYDQAGRYAQPNQFGQEYQQAQQYAPSNYAQGGAFDPQPQTGRMTYSDAMNKTAILLGATILSGVLAVTVLPLDLWMPVALVSTIAAFVLGMVIAFKRVVSPAMAIGYAVLEGVALGAISGAFDLMYPGIAMQAILATIVIVGVTLALHYSGAVRTTPRGRKFIYIVSLGYLVFSLINIVLMLTGLSDTAFGLRGMEIMGIPVGIILGGLMILVAAYMLIADFESVNFAVDNGAPKEFAWTCAIAIVMTILWIYVEVLRILAILAQDR